MNDNYAEAKEAPVSPFLRKLRNDGVGKWFVDNPGIAKAEILEHRSEYPSAIREVIAVAEGLEPTKFHTSVMTSLSALLKYCIPEPNRRYTPVELQVMDIPKISDEYSSSPWMGLNSKTDTEEEVEIAVRTFPSVLKCEEGFNYIFWFTTRFETLPFVPLLAELAQEFYNDSRFGGWGGRGGRLGLFAKNNLLAYGHYDDKTAIRELVSNELLLQFYPEYHSPASERQLDDISRTILIRLRDLELISKSDIRGIVPDLLQMTPSVTHQRLSFLLEWDPSLLLTTGFHFFDNNAYKSFLELWLKIYAARQPQDEGLDRFKMILERGMVHHPKQLGFLFHRESTFSYHHPYDIAAEYFGKEVITEAVNEILYKFTSERPYVIRNLFLEAGTNAKMISDGLYFLCRRDPTPFFVSFQKESSA